MYEMNDLINGYVESCLKVRLRIKQLTAMKNEFIKKGDFDSVSSLQLERRIQLLYVEHRDMKEIIDHLTAYMRRIQSDGRT